MVGSVFMLMVTPEGGHKIRARLASVGGIAVAHIVGERQPARAPEPGQARTRRTPMPRSKREARRDSAARTDQDRNAEDRLHDGTTSGGSQDAITDEGLGLS